LSPAIDRPFPTPPSNPFIDKPLSVPPMGPSIDRPFPQLPSGSTIDRPFSGIPSGPIIDKPLPQLPSGPSINQPFSLPPPGPPIGQPSLPDATFNKPSELPQPQPKEVPLLPGPPERRLLPPSKDYTPPGGDRTPAWGAPGTTEEFPKEGGGKTIRQYDGAGRATRDIDFGHDHGAGDPHKHQWDWTKQAPRQPGERIGR
jgi:hypothetical protein